MKTLSWLAILMVTASFPLLTEAADLARFVIHPESELELRGRATLRSWRFESHQVEGSVELEASLEDLDTLIDQSIQMIRTGADVNLRDLDLASGPPRIQVTIPVSSLTSGNSRMTRDMFRALKKDQFPTIEYEFSRLIGISLQQGADTSVTCFKLKTEGTLEIAGTRKVIIINVTATRHKKDHFKLFGQKRLKMTDFGITPPSAFFGLIRAHDPLDIVFDLSFKTDS